MLARFKLETTPFHSIAQTLIRAVSFHHPPLGGGGNDGRRVKTLIDKRDKGEMAMPIPTARDLVLVRRIAQALAEHAGRTIEPGDFAIAAAMLCARGRALDHLKAKGLLEANGSAVDVMSLIA
jgi:hypothetical protein